MRARSLWLPLLVLPLTACMQGEAGAKGEPGDPGADGAAGADGLDGQDGLDGADGQDGKDGEPGAAGADGQDGLDGQDGRDGQDGSSVDGQDGRDGQDGQDGLDGQDGQDGDDGSSGIDGHDGDGPWGIVVTVESVSGGTGLDGQLQPGDLPVVTFTLRDDQGGAYLIDSFDGVALQLVGPTTHRQVVIGYEELADVQGAATYDGDGTWTYSFATPVPDVYAAPANDTIDLGEAEGDWGGLPLVDGTYEVVAWAWMGFDDGAGGTWYDGGGGAGDVLVGAATTLEPHAVVSTGACAECHGPEFGAHGGMIRDVETCAACHVEGAEDRASATSPDVTPGTTIAWNVLIHRLHAGASLGSEVVYAGWPEDEMAEGSPDYNLYDYTSVNFPRWPMGVEDCASCHSGDAVNPTRSACGACHESVDWAAGTGHVGGPQADDTACAGCHSEADIAGYHADPRDSGTLSDGLGIEIVGVTGASGAGGQALAGDTLAVEFRLTRDDGTLYTAAAVDQLYLLLAGPLDHMEEAYKDTSFLGGTSATTTLTVNGADNFVASFVVPTTYPAQENDTVDLGEADGDWGGLPIVSGTWRIALGGYVSFLDGDGATQRDPASATLDLMVGADASTLETRDVVDEAACESCHGELLFHGDGRKGYAYCVTCHTAGGEDRYSGTDASVTPGVTIEWPVLIHKIHAAPMLTETWEVAGYSSSSSYTVHDWDDQTFPRMDGGVAACTACHGDSDAWTDPSTAICTTCHDAPSTTEHAALNTDESWGESCAVCHSAGRAFGADVVHDTLP